MQPAVYIMASAKRGTLYVGVTSHLVQRVWQHKQGLTEGFSLQHGIKQLVYYELHTNMLSAIEREKQIKKWRRQWKLDLVFKRNPDWADLWDTII